MPKRGSPLASSDSFRLTEPLHMYYNRDSAPAAQGGTPFVVAT